MSERSPEKTIAQERQDWTKAMSVVVTALTFVFGVVTYLLQSRTQAAEQLNQRKLEETNRATEQARSLDLRNRELSQRFREEQFSLYQKAMDSASILATRDSADIRDPVVQQAFRDFWSLYWGKLAMVESPDVANAMVDFGKGLGRCDTTSKPDSACQSCLKFLSLALAHRCRESVSSQWGEKLEKLNEDISELRRCRAWASGS